MDLHNPGGGDWKNARKNRFDWDQGFAENALTFTIEASHGTRGGRNEISLGIGSVPDKRPPKS
jgi:hypothetical protein